MWGRPKPQPDPKDDPFWRSKTADQIVQHCNRLLIVMSLMQTTIQSLASMPKGDDARRAIAMLRESADALELIANEIDGVRP